MVSTRWSSRSSYGPTLFFEHKLRPSDTGAIVIMGGATYVAQDVSTGGGYTHTNRAVAAQAGGALQLQIAPMIAIEAIGTFVQGWFFEDYHPGTRSHRVYSYGARMTMAVSEHLDLVPFFSAIPLTLNTWNFCEAGWTGQPIVSSLPNFVVLNGVRTDGVDSYDSGGYSNLGNLILMADQVPTPELPGYLDEVRIWTTPWTQARSTMQYTNQSGQIFTFDGSVPPTPGVSGCIVTL